MVEDVGRIFAAVPLPVDVRMALADRTSGLSIPGRLVPPENWHLTLRFLGWVDEVTYDRFLSGLEPLESEAPFPITLNGFGAFPRPKRATVVWAGVGEGAEGLTRLNEITEEAAQAAGLAGEDRPYHPHLTLSRVRPPADVRGLTEEAVRLNWTGSEVVIFRSHLGRGGARYEPLETIPLSG